MFQDKKKKKEDDLVSFYRQILCPAHTHLQYINTHQMWKDKNKEMQKEDSIDWMRASG